MKKSIVTPLLLAVLAVGLYATFGWLRLHTLQAEVETAFQTLADFYVAMDKEHVSTLQALPSLDARDRSSLAQYRKAIAVMVDAPLEERVASLRIAQGIGFALFGTASGSLVSDADYLAWRQDSSEAGMAYPIILGYNQAAKSVNDEIAAWPGTMFAWLWKLEPLMLLDVNGEPFVQRPSRI